MLEDDGIEAPSQGVGIGRAEGALDHLQAAAPAVIATLYGRLETDDLPSESCEDDSQVAFPGTHVEKPSRRSASQRLERVTAKRPPVVPVEACGQEPSADRARGNRMRAVAFRIESRQAAL